MAPSESIGQFEHVVLAAILALGDDGAYGVTIHAKVEEFISPRTVSLGAVYATLDRLEDKGLLTSWLSDPTPERGGRSKRHYRLESSGERALRDATVAAKRICDDLERIWGEDVWTAGRRWKPARHS
jgi:PadR family transcriptional regulator, regulatory protein PadR